MKGYDYVTKSFVRFRDTDPMQMTNHAVVFSYLETARTEYMKALLGFEKVRDIPYLMAHVECDFRSPSSYGDVLKTGVRISEIGSKSFTMEYRVEQADSGRLVAEAETVQVFYDYDNEEPTSAPPDFRERVASFDADQAGGE